MFPDRLWLSWNITPVDETEMRPIAEVLLLFPAHRHMATLKFFPTTYKDIYRIMKLHNQVLINKLLITQYNYIYNKQLLIKTEYLKQKKYLSNYVNDGRLNQTNT